LTAQHCKTCKYFSQEGFRDMGVCKRYPTFQNRNSTDWCGEHNPILPSTITLPKVNLELGVVMNPAVTDQAEKKKPGRPKLSGRQIP